MKSKNHFEPFGLELPLINSTDNRIIYTGQERDTFTNYDYMHFRFYASSMGRFLQPDNIIPDITNPQNWNAYTYVKGNPVNFNDPSGHGPNVRPFPTWMGPTISEHFLATTQETYSHFHELTGSWEAATFFSGMDISVNQVESAMTSVLNAAGIQGANQAFKDWVSDALVNGFNFDKETINALHSIYSMSTAYGIELGFYFSRTSSGDLAIIVIFGTEKSVPASMFHISQEPKTSGQISEYQFFHKQIGFEWKSWFLYGHTHLPGYGISEEDVSTYCKAWFKNPKPLGIVIEQNMEGQTVISRIGFSVDFNGLVRIVIEPFKETWRNPW